MVAVRWLEDSPQPPPAVRWLGMPPLVCLQNPAFAQCYGAQAPQAIAACENEPPEARGECTLYYNDYYAYQHCRHLCPSFAAPIKPTTFPSSGQPARTIPPTTSTESKTSPGLVLAAVAVVGVIAVIALTS